MPALDAARLGKYELNHIYTGDARELVQEIPAESVSLIFSDPVYDRVDDYEWLAETAARLLKPDRACLVWAGIAYLPQVLAALQKHLTYRWMFASVLPRGKRGAFAQEKMFSNWRCLIWAEKGRSRPAAHFADVSVESDNSYDGFMRWGKSVVTSRFWLNAFARPGGVVFDPFAGGGTVPVACKMLGYDYLAFELDANRAELARERVSKTQPALPLVQIEQGAWL